MANTIFENVLNTLENKDSITVITSVKAQKENITAVAGVKIIEITEIPENVNPKSENWLVIKDDGGNKYYEPTADETAIDGTVYYMAVRRTFTEFCDYMKSVNYCLTPTKKLLCEVGGMTAADWVKLNNALDVIRCCLLDWRASKRLLDDSQMTKSKVKAVTALVEIKRSNVYSALKLIKMILGVDIKATPNDIEWLSGRCITAKYRNSTNIKSGYKFDICGNMTVLSNIFKLFSAQADAETALTDAGAKFEHIRTALDTAQKALETAEK